MTREEYLNQFFELYQLISVLSDRNDCKTLRLRHKALHKDIVLRSFPTPVEAYEILCSLHCENLPEIYESTLLDDGQIVLEEYISGITLAQMLETQRYPYKTAKKILLQVCNALAVLHEHKIVHRDVKPENILITDNGRIVLIDFNIARIEKEKSRDTEVLGTMGYASPEQLGIAQSDSRTDTYAAGVLLNVMLTGAHPSAEIAKGRPGRIVRKCTNINPKYRYASAKKLAKDL